jgi:predicted DNA-binding protein (UPF0251 family)
MTIILSPEQIESIEIMAGRGLTLDDIALILKISPKTLDRRLSDCEEVREAYDRGRAIAKQTVTEALFKQIERGKLAAIFFYLKTQCGWRETDKPTSDRQGEIHIYLPEKNQV